LSEASSSIAQKMQQISGSPGLLQLAASEILRQKLAASEGDLRKARERAGTWRASRTEVHER
jgi:hypothetical protein